VSNAKHHGLDALRLPGRPAKGLGERRRFPLERRRAPTWAFRVLTANQVYHPPRRSRRCSRCATRPRAATLIISSPTSCAQRSPRPRSGLALASSGSSGGVPPVTVRTANVTVPGGTASSYVPATFSVDCAAGEVAVGGGFKPRRLVWMLGSFPESYLLVGCGRGERADEADEGDDLRGVHVCRWRDNHGVMSTG
jgi:hypothetical protein